MHFFSAFMELSHNVILQLIHECDYLMGALKQIKLT